MSIFTTVSACTHILALLSTGAVGTSPQQIPNLDLDQAERVETPKLPCGVTTSAWSSIRDSISTRRHAFKATHNGFEANNPRFKWEAQFDGTSALIQPAAGDWSFGFTLKAFGFENRVQYLKSPTFGACAEGQKLTYGWSNELSEWWINDERGFEHGFTVHERPERLATDDLSPLIFELEALGSLQPRVNEARTGLSLHDDAGVSVLRYDGLVAFDAEGIRLPAWLEVDERSVRICVFEALAKYPIVVDPVIQEAYIKASNADAGDNFGSSIAVSGDTIVVGAPEEGSSATGIGGNQSNNSRTDSGAAYVFVRSGSSWIQQAYLKASNTGVGDYFGSAVSISGDTIVVSAPTEDSSATGIDGDQSSNSRTDSGAAYVFVRSGTSWTQQAYLKASNAGSGDQFGRFIAASGETIVVGAPSEDSNATGIDGNQSNNSASAAGASYVFVRSGSLWTQQAYLKASNTDAGDFFGDGVAVSGETVIVGAAREDSSATGIDGDQFNNSSLTSGAAYVFVRTGSSWTQQAYLKASNTDAGDQFGDTVTISGDTVAIGAPRENSNAKGIDGNQFNNSSLTSGAAYVFVRTGSSWTQQAYLKASNTGPGDQFSRSIAAYGDTVVVGAFFEDSNATGIYGDQSNNSAQSSGAAYAFLRSGSSWAQQAYLKASNTDAGDIFGVSVAASRGTVVVGAVYESSNATGFDGDQSNNSANESGAAYFFSAGEIVGTPFCTAVANSTGSAGELAGSGSTSVTNNSLTLVATELPVGAVGFYLASGVQGFIANPGGGDGNLCLGGWIGRYNRPSQLKQADTSGSFSLRLDLMNTPTPFGPVPINIGETWNFQGWFRDTNMTGPTSNLTNGLEVMFTM